MKKKEINRYRLALLQYCICWLFPFKPVKRLFVTEYGFCKHFWAYTCIDSKIPVLYSLRPDKSRIWASAWFKPGLLRPRIKLLWQAIKECKKREDESIEEQLKYYSYK